MPQKAKRKKDRIPPRTIGTTYRKGIWEEILRECGDLSMAQLEELRKRQKIGWISLDTKKCTGSIHPKGARGCQGTEGRREEPKGHT